MKEEKNRLAVALAVFAAGVAVLGPVPPPSNYAIAAVLMVAGPIVWFWPSLARYRSVNAASDVCEPFPSLRVADHPAVLALFEGAESDRLFPLLEDQRLLVWGRQMGAGSPPLLRIPGATWRSHGVSFIPKGSSDGTINQTFVKENQRQETRFYDLHLSRTQLLHHWPSLNLRSFASAAEGELRAKDAVGQCIEEQLVPVLLQRPASNGKLIAAASGHIESLSANLERRGTSETLVLLDEFRQNATVAFDNLTNAFASSRRYKTLEREEQNYSVTRAAWWDGFNRTVSAVRDLPGGLNRQQIDRFIHSDLECWSRRNAEAIAWANAFVSRLSEQTS